MLDEQTRKRLEQMTRADQEIRFHELCQLLGTLYPQTLKGVDQDPISLKQLEEYKCLKKLLGL
jgi:hypothetical protein